MQARRRIAIALAAALAAAPGCAGTAPFGWLGRSAATSEPPFAIEQSASADSYVQRMQQPPPQTSQSAAADPATSPFRQTASGGMTASITSAMAKVGDALTIDPKVIPADDPVRLSSMPQHVGPEVFVATARAYEQQGQLDAAQEQYERALAAAPNDAGILVAYARLFDRQGAPQQALQVYDRALQANPTSALVLNDLALCRARQGDLPGSLQALSRAVEIEPKRAMYRNNLATVLAEAGRFDEAFQQLAAAHPPAVAHYNMGFLLQQRQRTAEARAHFAKCLELDPGLAAAQRQLAQLDNAPANGAPASGPGGAPPTQLNAAGGAASGGQFSTRTSSYSPANSPAGGANVQVSTGAYAPQGELQPPVVSAAPAENWGQAPSPESYGSDPSSYTAPRLLPPVR